MIYAAGARAAAMDVFMPPSKRFICIHGHFYQPPRENPWLETVETQDSAAPYHDWNERICAECYATNGAARIVNNRNLITSIVNNYARISFNVGPTLLSWLKENAPRTYRMILDGERTSRKNFQGHSSAIAQVYNHMILPLASTRDRVTQIRWGIADYVSNYGERPEGMWLAETAADAESLELMAQNGIKFTVLAPHQCKRIRPIKDAAAAWIDTPNASVDTTHPYLVRFASGASIAVFFYNGPASRAIAFEGLLNSGENFAARLKSGFKEGSQPQLSHVATDGESYGHHHKYGEMALAWALNLLERDKTVTLINYAGFLEQFPPEYECEIVDKTSWSCVHGVERWQSDCGCNGGKPGWNQEWRAPLREALDFLRDSTAPLAEQFAAPLLTNLWAARDAYIDVVLDRSPASKDRFFAQHATHTLSPEERVAVIELLELQRHTQLMYTSCGWFFDELSGIETIQIIAYAGRVLQLARKLFGDTALFGSPGLTLEEAFLNILARAKSNLPDMGTGADIYRRYVTGIRIGLDQVGAHYAISSIFRSYPEDGELFCFDLHRDAHESFTSGRGKVALGRATIRSRITEEAEDIFFAVLHLGDQNLSAAVRRYSKQNPDDLAAFTAFSADLGTAIRRANLPDVVRLIDRFFGTLAYSLTSLFADEQHRILRTILDRTLAEMEESLRKIYDDHASLLRYLTQSGVAAPPALAIAANFAINSSLRRAIEADNFDLAEIEALFTRAAADQIALDIPVLAFTAAERIKRAMVALEAAASTDQSMMTALRTALAVATGLRSMPFDVNLWQAQNIWNDLFLRSDRNYWSPEWKLAFKKLGEALYIRVDELVIDEGVSTP